MNKKHTPSFLLSIFIHIAAGLIVYFTYQLASSLKKDKKKEELICMSLSTYSIKNKPKITSQKKVPKLKVAKTIVSKQKVIQTKKLSINKKIKPKQLVKIPNIESVQKRNFKEDEVEDNVTKVEVTDNNTSQYKLQPDKQPSKELNTTKKSPSKKDISQNSPQEKYMNNHINEISQLLADNLYYPRRARKKGIIGEVVVKFVLHINGDADSIEIASSKYNILSRAAAKTIENLSGTFPKPEEELQIQIPILYRLNN